jgi:hypothetical protein
LISIPMTPAQVAAKEAQLKQEFGIVVSGTSGEVTIEDVDVAWTYDGTTFGATVLHKSFLVRGVYESKLKAALLAPFTA